MRDEVTTLPIAPQDFWGAVALIGIIVLTAVIYWVIDRTGKAYRPPIWEDLREGWRSAAILTGLLWLGLFGLTIWAAYAGIWQAIRQNTGTEGADTTPLGFGLGALVAAMLGAPFLIWNTVIKQRSLGFQKEGHITDRISKAVEQLGAEKTVKRPLPDNAGTARIDAEGKPLVAEQTLPNIEVRIGGILSLERIAQDSCAYDRGRDHVRVMEILCAYVRENAPASEAKDHPFGEWVPLKDNPTDKERATRLAKQEERFGMPLVLGLVRAWARALPLPREDIAQALKVIGRRDAGQRRVEARWGKNAAPDAEWVFDRECPTLPERNDDTALPQAELEAYRARLEAWKGDIDGYAGYRPDLRNTNLQKADLSAAVLSGGLLQGARMEGADLGQARMEGAKLTAARMEGADLEQVRLEGADLGEARMEGADLRAARMEETSLLEARMEGASLEQARLIEAHLGLARLEGANLGRARMEGAYLGRARMEWADLAEARMEGAYLTEARMEGAFLGAARMEEADLREARMEGAYLGAARMDQSTDLTGAVLRGASVRAVDWSSVDLSPGQVSAMFGDASVILPGGVRPGHKDWPAHWPVWNLDTDAFRDQWRAWQADPAAHRPPLPPAPKGGPRDRPADTAVG